MLYRLEEIYNYPLFFDYSGLVLMDHSNQRTKFVSLLTSQLKSRIVHEGGYVSKYRNAQPVVAYCFNNPVGGWDESGDDNCATSGKVDNWKLFYYLYFHNKFPLLGNRVMDCN